MFIVNIIKCNLKLIKQILLTRCPRLVGYLWPVEDFDTLIKLFIHSFIHSFSVLIGPETIRQRTCWLEASFNSLIFLPSALLPQAQTQFKVAGKRLQDTSAEPLSSGIKRHSLNEEWKAKLVIVVCFFSSGVRAHN